MGWKCTPQFYGLVRGEKKPGQKHRANAERICLEAGQERVSRSETLDRARTKDNVYTYESSGYALYDSMVEEADAYRQKYKKRDGTFGERPLRKDAVIGFAVIFNPPGEVCKDWTNSMYQKFYEDSWEVVKQIQPKVFSDDNIRMVAEHKDEGMLVDKNVFTYHSHVLGVPKDANGRYCGNLIDAKLMVDINKNYPRMMRELGWDIDDLECTDFKKEKGKGKGGKSVNDYLRDKLREKVAEADKMLQEVTELQTGLQEDREALDNEMWMMEQEHKQRLEKADMELREALERYKEKEAGLVAEYNKKLEQLAEAMKSLEEEKSAGDDVMETVLDKCVYRYRSAKDGKVYSVKARDYYQQIKRNRAQTVDRITREIPDIVKVMNNTKDFDMGE